MIKFLNAPILFKNSGLLLLCSMLFLFIFCLTPFQSGTWFNTEPAMLALFVLATLDCLWLATGIGKNWLALELPLHPLIYGLLAWAMWQFIPFLTIKNPIHSWMGIPQTGEGGAWQVMLAVMVFFIMPLWQLSAYRKILLVAGFASLCSVAYLQFDPSQMCKLYTASNDPALIPAIFSDYLPFIIGWLWIAYGAAPSVRTPTRYFWMVFISSLVIFTSQSTSAVFVMYPLLVGIGVILFLQLIGKTPKFISAQGPWKILAVIGILLPLLWTFIPLKSELKICNNTSIAIRKVINEVSLSTIAHEPERMLFGNGWGNYKNDVFKYAMVDGVHSFKDGQFSPNFVWLNGNIFHPHNQPIAALFALGIVGFIIFMALPVLAIIPLRKNLFWWCVPMLIGVNAIGVMWFTLPQVLPFQALGLASLCAGRKMVANSSVAIPKYISAVFLLLSLAFAASAVHQETMIAYGERLQNIMNEDPAKPGIAKFIESDIANGGERMVQGLLYFTGNIAAKIAAGTATQHDSDWYKKILEIAHQAAISKNASMEMVKLEPEFSMLLFRLPNASPLDELKPQVKNTLVDSILLLSAKAPQREDAIAFFLMSLDGFTNGDTAKQKEILENILKVAPDHRSALWLLGTMKNNNEMKKKAVSLGVEKVYPVTQQELAQFK